MSHALNSISRATVTIKDAICITAKSALDVIVSATVTSAKVAASALAILTLGKSATINQWTIPRTTNDAQILLPIAFKAALAWVNPSASRTLKLQTKNHGALSNMLGKPIESFANKCLDDNSGGVKQIFMNHIAARGAFLAGAAAVISTKTVELGLGILSAAVAIVTLGLMTRVNQFAIAYLGSLDGIHCACYALQTAVNPWPAKLSKTYEIF